MEYFIYLMESKAKSSTLSREDKETKDFLIKELQISPEFLKLQKKYHAKSPNAKNLQQLIDSLQKEFEQDKKNAISDYIPQSIPELMDRLQDMSPFNDYYWKLLMDKLGITTILRKVLYIKPDIPGEELKRLKTADPEKYSGSVLRSYFYSWIAAPVIVMWVIQAILNIFTNFAFNRFAATKMKKHTGNEKIYNYLVKNIKSIYRTNPNYRPVSNKEFEKTWFWNKYLADFRDKTKLQKCKPIGEAALLGLISTCIKRFLPFGEIMEAPALVMLGFFGIRLPTTEMITFVTELEGNTLTIGLSFRPFSFILVNPKLYVQKDGGKLVAIPLKEIPKELYQPKKEDLKVIMDATKKNPMKTIKRFKSKVSYINDSAE